MASKAKSGLSAVRQFPEKIIEPPNLFAPAATSFVSAIRDGKGHSEYHVAAANTTAFTLKILHSWRSTGPFTQDQSIAAVVDPETGLFVAEIIAPISKRYIRIVVDAPAPGLDATDFEVGGYFLPRPSGAIITSNSGPGGVTPTKGSPGTVITTSADIVVGIGVTVPLTVPPAGTRRMCIQAVAGDETTEVRIREVGGTDGRKLVFNGSTMYGGADGAVAALEAENVAGPASAVHIDFERD